MFHLRSRSLVLIASLAHVIGCAGASAGTVAAKPPPTRVDVPTQIVTPGLDGSENELTQRGERALLAQRFAEAAQIFETLLRASPPAERIPQLTMNLAAAYEGMEARELAQARYRDMIQSYPDDKLARMALLRIVSIDVYLEDWNSLGRDAEALLARRDIDAVDRMTALGARGLSRAELGDDGHAMTDIQNGLDLLEENHYGMTGRLPHAAAQLKFALGEVRRLRSEKIHFTAPLVDGTMPEKAAVPPDFLPKMEARCQGLLDAQAAYADAMRAIDPHWIAMSGYRVGEMYRKLHHDLMVIPPTLLTKTDKQRQIFFAIMHVRYRVLLEKGLEMVKRTLVLGERQLDSSAWVRRADEMRREIEQALEEEKAVLKSFPFTEQEIEGALDILKKKAEKERLAKERAAEKGQK
jgi:tetratricopeptide (TPR) repeat protein